jgi:hypothetical protein
MKIKALILMLAFISATITISAQTPEKTSSSTDSKNVIGIHIIPVLDPSGLFSSISYGLRYGYKPSSSLTLGAELAGSFPALNPMPIPYSDFMAGAFARYTFFPEKRINGFLEASPFFGHNYIRGTNFYPGDRIINKFGLYVAPGISLYTKSRKLSMDLYYKFYIHPGDMYYHKNTFSYKLNFHF